MAGLTQERAAELLNGLSKIRALVIGDLMIDRYISGTVERVSPEAPVPVVRVEEERAAIGGAGNVAANVAALGAGCDIVGCVGDDEAGEAMKAELVALGVAVDGVVSAADRPTTVKTRVTARHQQIVRFDHESERDVDDETSGRLGSAISALAGSCDVLIMEDYNKGVLVPGVIGTALTEAESKGIPSVVDPKRRNFFEFGGVTVFKPNAKELADALGAFIHPDDPEWMEATRSRLGCANLVLTLGDRGLALQGEDQGHLRVPAVAQSVYDVSGAGDTVTAVVASIMAAGGTAAEAAIIANHAAAVEVSKTGVATVSPAEILRHFAIEAA